MISKMAHDNDTRSPDREEGARQHKKARTARNDEGIGSTTITAIRNIDPMNVAEWTPRGKCLVVKSRSFQFINTETPPWVVVQLAKIADKMYIYGGFGKTGDGIALLKHINVGHTIIDQILKAEYADLMTNCSEENMRENKEIFWLFAASFLICFFEVKAKKQFTIQYFHPKELVEQFLAMHSEFKDYDGLLIARLLTFHLCTQIAVSAFEFSVKSESDVQRIIELVVRMTEGPELAHAAFRADDGTPEPLKFGSAPKAVVQKARRIIFDKILEIKRNTRKEKESAAAEAAESTSNANNVDSIEKSNGAINAASASDTVAAAGLCSDTDVPAMANSGGGSPGSVTIEEYKGGGDGLTAT